MFSGIIEGTGIVKSLTKRNDAAQLEIQAQYALGETQIGDSIAVNGCCLTITSRLGNTVWADLSEETLRVTTLGQLQPDDWVNLEQALRYGGRVGGHLVQGHVDGVGTVRAIVAHEGSHEITIEVPLPLTRYLIKRGSLAVDGVSLTAAECRGTEITIFVIPHTELKTTFQRIQVGDCVNLEMDMMGKYIEQLAQLPAESYHGNSWLRRAFRKRHGFT